MFYVPTENKGGGERRRRGGHRAPSEDGTQENQVGRAPGGEIKLRPGDLIQIDLKS